MSDLVIGFVIGFSAGFGLIFSIGYYFKKKMSKNLENLGLK